MQFLLSYMHIRSARAKPDFMERGSGCHNSKIKGFGHREEGHEQIVSFGVRKYAAPLSSRLIYDGGVRVAVLY